MNTNPSSTNASSEIARNALRAANIFWIAGAVSLPVYSYAAYQAGAWQLYGLVAAIVLFVLSALWSRISIQRGNVRLGINLIFGQKVDNQANTIFLPLDLYDNLKNISHKSKPLVSETNTVFEANRKTPISYLNSIYSLIAILLLFVILNKRATNIIYFSILGFIGLLFSFMCIYSFHKELYWNYNILLLNPLFLFLVFFMIKNNTKWVKKLSLIGLLFLGSYSFYMIEKIHFIIVLPIIIATFIILLRLILKKQN